LEKILKYAEKPEIKEVVASNVDGKIENFWFEALDRSGEFEGQINKKDKEILSHLTNIKIALDPMAENNFTLLFNFAKNEYFNADVLERKHVFLIGSTGEPEIKRIESTKIEWLSDDKNPTIEMKKVKVKCKYAK
jgi:nucleosome assembly protein 1-like 1